MYMKKRRGNEISEENRAKKKNLQNVILDIAYITGVVSMAILAPNAVQALRKLGLTPHKRQIESIKESTEKLIRKGFLEIHNGDIRITNKGRSYLARQFKIGKPKRWDKKWRVVIFDIPEKYRYARDNVRISLQNIGFKKIQNSVWVYPHNCEQFISLLRSDLEISNNLLYMIVDTIEDDDSLKKYFKL